MKFYVVKQITIAGVIFALGACTDSPAQPPAEAAGSPGTGAGAAGTVDQSPNTSAVGTTTATAASAPVSTDQNKTAAVTTKKNDAAAKGAAGSTKGAAGAAAPATKDKAEPEKPTAEEQQILDMMADTSKRYDSATLTPIYEKLATVPKEFMVGTWKGGLFIAGSNSTSTWYGKRVAPDFTAEPMLSKAADGGPGPNTGGGATVSDAQDANGVTTACLAYDNGTVRDYFRKVRGDLKQRAIGDVVIGLGGGLFFNLTRIEL